jgi:hypothetical protein
MVCGRAARRIRGREGTLGDFTELPVQTGVGEYHINRFRVAFAPPPSCSGAALASDLIDNFPSYLKSPFATVEFGSRKHQGKDTLRFHGYARLLGFDVGFIHFDWVAREWVNRAIGFTAQTLKREFFEAGEDLGIGVPSMAGGLVGEIAGAAGVHYNRMHFLAGRRSWRVGDGVLFGVSGNVLVLETVAVERFSATPFMVADAVIGLESKLPDVWAAMLCNFVDKRRLTSVRQPLKPRWKNKGRVDYMTRSFPDFGAMAADPEYQDIYRLYPTIIP